MSHKCSHSICSAAIVFLHVLRQSVIVVGQILSGGRLSVAVPLVAVMVHELGVDWRSAGTRDVRGGDVLLLLGQQILDESRTYFKRV